MSADVVWSTVAIVNAIVFVYFVALNGVYGVTTVVGVRALRRYVRRLRSIDIDEHGTSPASPPITIIVPAFNEEAMCVEAVRALLAMQYAEFEVLVVNDGSQDRTVDLLSEAYALKRSARLPSAELPAAEVRCLYRSRTHPNLWLIDKANGGKADATNAGLNYTRTPLFCVIDADGILERDALARISRPFLEDARTIAAGGIIRIVNGSIVRHGTVEDPRLPRNFLARVQVLEYLRAFLTGRVAWSEVNATLIVSGAFGLFKRSVVVDAGGFATDTVGEDMELVLRLHRYCRERGIPYRVTFVPDPVAWTEAPETLRGLGNQRDRWQRGLIQCLMRHRRLLFNPRYGAVGLLAFPYFFFLEMLGPMIELVGYLAFVVTVVSGRASAAFIVAFLLLAMVFGVVLSAVAVSLEELTLRRYARWSDLWSLLALSVAENVGYRQATLFWRVRGTFSAFRRSKGWGAIPRKGFTARPPS